MIAWIREDLEFNEIEMLSFVDKGASGNDVSRPKIILCKRHLEPAPMKTLAEVISGLLDSGKLDGLISPEDKSVLVAAMEPAPVEVMDADKPMEPPATSSDTKPDELLHTAKRSSDPLVAELVKAHQDLIKENDAYREKEFVAKVQQDMAFLPGKSVTEIAKMCRTLQKNLGSNEFKEVEDLLKSASILIGQSELMKSAGKVGSDASQDPDGDPEAEIMKAASDLRKKDEALSLSDAIVKAGTINKNLYARYVAKAQTKKKD